jgi:hypothetical protein
VGLRYAAALALIGLVAAAPPSAGTSPADGAVNRSKHRLFQTSGHIIGEERE